MLLKRTELNQALRFSSSRNQELNPFLELDSRRPKNSRLCDFAEALPYLLAEPGEVPAVYPYPPGLVGVADVVQGQGNRTEVRQARPEVKKKSFFLRKKILNYLFLELAKIIPILKQLNFFSKSSISLIGPIF